MDDFTVTLHLGEWFDYLIHLRVNIWLLILAMWVNDFALKPMWSSCRDMWERYR